MSYLGTVLNLEDGSRLTGIALRPLAREVTERFGTIYFHLVLTDGDAAAESGAVATLMRSTLATIHGTSPDGGAWFATFQFTADDGDPVWAERTADAAVHRALDLIGSDNPSMRSPGLTVDALRDTYAQAGTDDFADWRASDLLTGLLVELTNVPLTDVVHRSTTAIGQGDDAATVRGARLHQMLASWAQTYEGPTR